MRHAKRCWRSVTVDSPEELAAQLTTPRLSLSAAFRIGQYFWLNDSDSLTGTQDFAVLKRLRSGRYAQLESVSCGWGDLTGTLQMILATLNGQYDQNAWRSLVTPVFVDVTPQDNWPPSGQLPATAYRSVANTF